MTKQTLNLKTAETPEGRPFLVLPSLFYDADSASEKGQRRTLLLSRIRLIAAVTAAIGGAFTLHLKSFNLWALVSAASFSIALIAELVLAMEQPERNWYSGRAIAESTKTLAWRFAVGGDPFPISIEPDAAAHTLHERLTAVLQEGRDRLVLNVKQDLVTPEMLALRGSSFETRQDKYIENRTEQQARWYANKATHNMTKVRRARVALIGGELIAILLSVIRFFGYMESDLAGILAAAVAGIAAWASLRQYSNLASAYTVAANELSMQVPRLRGTPEPEWPAVVGDVEAAISREHIMWLASKTS